MDKIKSGLELDISQNYADAILQYEQEIKDGTQSVDTYINLAFLYWVCAAQFAWADEFLIPNENRLVGIEKSSIILNQAKQKFPNYGEIYFWEKYFNHRLIFDPFNEDDVLSIIEKYHSGNNLTPYFFLYLFNTEKYSFQKNELLKNCIICPTAKNIYIKSIIEN